VYKGFERGERFLESLPNLSHIPQATFTNIVISEPNKYIFLERKHERLLRD
jgi:hypothetical protein